MRSPIEWPLQDEQITTGDARLENILSQQTSVLSPAFRVLTRGQMGEFRTAIPHMTDEEKWRIADATHTPQLVYKIAEAVGRVRATWVKF